MERCELLTGDFSVEGRTGGGGGGGGRISDLGKGILP